MRWRWAGWTAAALLLVAAGVVLTRSVPVAGGATCGSAWDVVTGRADWTLWWSQDGADPLRGAVPVRTRQCPGAVDSRLAAAGVLAALAAAAAATGELLHPARARGAGPAARRLRRWGAALMAGGSAATVAGLVGLVAVTGDPHATMFDYVDRPAAVLAGILLLLPALLIAALGAVAHALAGALEEHDAPP